MSLLASLLRGLEAEKLKGRKIEVERVCRWEVGWCWRLREGLEARKMGRGEGERRCGASLPYF
jgi:hypothetical protein